MLQSKPLTGHNHMNDTLTKSERYVDKRLRELAAGQDQPSPAVRSRHYARNYSRAYRGTPEGARTHWESMLRRKYGIGLADYETLLAAQGDACALCGEPIASAYRHVLVFGLCKAGGKRGTGMVDLDPDGTVRGIVCVRCNTGLGCFRRSARLLELGLRYLTRGRESELE